MLTASKSKMGRGGRRGQQARVAELVGRLLHEERCNNLFLKNQNTIF